MCNGASLETYPAPTQSLMDRNENELVLADDIPFLLVIGFKGILLTGVPKHQESTLGVQAHGVCAWWGWMAYQSLSSQLFF